MQIAFNSRLFASQVLAIIRDEKNANHKPTETLIYHIEINPK